MFISTESSFGEEYFKSSDLRQSHGKVCEEPEENAGEPRQSRGRGDKVSFDHCGCQYRGYSFIPLFCFHLPKLEVPLSYHSRITCIPARSHRYRVGYIPAHTCRCPPFPTIYLPGHYVRRTMQLVAFWVVIEGTHVDSNDVCHCREGREAGTDFCIKAGVFNLLRLFSQAKASKSTHLYPHCCASGGKERQHTWPHPPSRKTRPNVEVLIAVSTVRRRSVTHSKFLAIKP